MKRIVLLVISFCYLLANNINNPINIKTYNIDTNKVIEKKIITQTPVQPMIVKVKRIDFTGQVNPDKEFTFKIYQNPKNQEELQKIVAEKMQEQFSKDAKYKFFSTIVFFIMILAFAFISLNKTGNYIFLVAFIVIFVFILSLLFIDTSLLVKYDIKIIQKFKPAEYTFKESFSIQNNKILNLTIKNQVIEPCKKKICEKEYLISLRNIAEELNKLKQYKVITNVEKVILKSNCLILLRTKDNTGHKIKVITENNDKCSRQDVLNDSNIYPLKVNKEYYIDVYKYKKKE